MLIPDDVVKTLGKMTSDVTSALLILFRRVNEARALAIEPFKSRIRRASLSGDGEDGRKVALRKAA